ncbi:MAG: hypothetical protein KKF41_10910 [Actinobacteria bacterium]|nr:hypothetical protein [Actinomycetota bacterium]MBU1944879.1 hypothetical protein [Actinomycetota bacterium]MBU2688083.1 hypothetical protein [Actinomycetota bacterium]
MRIKTTAVTFDEGELARLRCIIDAEDGEEALRFVRDVLEEKVKANELPHCVPFFDAGYNPGQADAFGEGRKRCRKG